MIPGGIQKTSLIDYPGKLACVIFLSGCNLRCPYCHNPGLAEGRLRSMEFPDMSRIMDFLERRIGLLDGVVVSGGEPTIHPGLESLCRKIKAMGYALKLDTNGTRPRVIRRLLEKGLVDYVAMDLKTDLDRYGELGARDGVNSALGESIRLLLRSAVTYEFRTTCVKPFVDETVVKNLARTIRGARLYALQPFQETVVLRPEFFGEKSPAFDRRSLQALVRAAVPYVERCILRGADNAAPLEGPMRGSNPDRPVTTTRPL
ncbi:MAG: anaerobic ribonucleoside-triphosphate reductase activating protein [Deltaproteobacteria bacterium]|nr:anaerobic ribonucleoside-triphosphate reductase activating protein [Deltaproteobacteria bacterium]MBW1924634.1 anaerobic ribonucleoside-triphosphate reductase activating protein [Deltaproteobacteria bacterium]MBW1950336.1 anaerobic ribonucleoside-triphosphate reductase activating protein [Deltaproteobacteria bacterium]MBW2008890.1 anaerobic ribonucleoside-triphosphate reductase activating protein [Deltaproteobacteria bacterium]MBW2348745.1 anaerobic ribonucleoside-triphosphate reductase acti